MCDAVRGLRREDAVDGVVLADIATMPGFERHTFRCLDCPQIARRCAQREAAGDFQ